MTDSMIRLITAVVLLAHGLGHLMGILAGSGIKLSETHSLKSWLLTGWLGEPVSVFIGMFLSVVTFILFGLSGFALMNWGISAIYWPDLAISASILSLTGLFVYWDSLPFLVPNKMGVLFMDCLILLSVIKFNWPPEIYT